MIGAVIGDIVGSVYEFHNIKTKNFPLFSAGSSFTDDSVMTIAVAHALSEWEKKEDIDAFKRILIARMHDYGRRYPHAGYGGRFRHWLRHGDTEPYGSYGNGSAMRVSAVAYYAKNLEDALTLAEASAAVTHNHPEGIKGAAVTAGATFLARNGASKEEIRHFVEGYYDISFTLDEIRPSYRFNETCQGTVPQAMVAFFESAGFEDALRCAISIGGDSDTLAAITGAVAEAFYGVPRDLKRRALARLDAPLRKVCKRFMRIFK